MRDQPRFHTPGRQIEIHEMQRPPQMSPHAMLRTRCKLPHVPARGRTADVTAWTGCIAGAMTKTEFASPWRPRAAATARSPRPTEPVALLVHVEVGERVQPA